MPGRLDRGSASPAIRITYCCTNGYGDSVVVLRDRRLGPSWWPFLDVLPKFNTTAARRKWQNRKSIRQLQKWVCI